MPAAIDHPQPEVPLDPEGFWITGWLWLADRHAQLASVEAWHGDKKLGSVAVREMVTRPDVSARFGFPAEVQTGFALTAHHPSPPTAPFGLSLHGRLRDGSLTEPVITSEATPLSPAHDPLGALRTRLPATARGLEIGAHALPAKGLTPFYTDVVANFAGSQGRVDFLADALALPLPNESLDYLCSSHVIEHLPNPLAALHEWHRVLRPGAWLYLVAPDMRHTFDAGRAVTPVSHMLRDFLTGAPPADCAEHVEEFVFQTDWGRLRPDCPVAERAAQQGAAHREYLRALHDGEPIDIHYHTFTPESLQRLLLASSFLGGDAPRFELVMEAERYPPDRIDGIALLLRKRGEPGDQRPPATCSLGHANPAIPPLPLVCPVSLAPLHLESAADGTRAFSAAITGLRYPHQASLPSLLPPRGAAPQRPWTAPGWRLAQHQRAETVLSSLPMRAHLDNPSPDVSVDPLCFQLRGWAWLGDAQPRIAVIEAWAGEILIGETAALYARPDVNAALGLAANAATGFEIFAHHPTASVGAPIHLHLQARLRDGSRTAPFATAAVPTIARDYRTNHFGILLDQRTTAVQRHDNLFATGPSLAEGSGELAALLRRYLGPPPRRVIDVGCGLGSYGRSLFAEGYGWMGAEIDATDCAELSRLGLPHRHVDGNTLPFADGAFDAALCLEVLEHIDEPRAFLREVRRVAPKQLIVSVPNCELLGYLWDHLATPWHMLESTHVNFFTRWSLGNLLREFYPRVELRFYTPYPLPTIEGTPLHYNLLAIATGD